MARFAKMTKRFLIIQLVGSAMLLTGAWMNIALYGLGIILLLPGSAVAPFIPLRSVGSSMLLSLTGIDGAGYENLLYLPLALVVNCACVFLFNWFAGRRHKPGS